MKNYLDALKRRKEETGESGFSLIELIVVVVILGILAAIAVPVFLGLQGQAEASADQTLAANGASQASAEFAQGGTPTATTLANLNTTDVVLSIAIGPSGTGTTMTIENFCVTASRSGTAAATSGPGC